MFKLIHESRGYEGSDFTQSPKRIEMTLDTEEASLDELLEFYGDFLKACTFVFDGQVQIVNDEDSLQSLRDDFESLDSLHDNENVDTSGYEPIEEETAQTEFNFDETKANQEVKE